jgi:DNA-binding NtrC family response regulator
MGRILSVAQERPEYRKSRMAGMRAIPDHVGVEQPGGEASKRVLVVDDHAELRAALRDMLLHEGYEVEEAADGAEALDLLAEREFGAAIVDMRMPRVDGLTVLEEIRERGIRCPTVLVAAMADAESRRRADELGAFAFHQKPFTLDALLRDLRAALASGG